MDINLTLKALANDKRLAILRWLKHPSRYFQSPHCDVDEQGVCVGLIEQKIGLSQSTVSQYLTQLCQASLITMEKHGPWTYCRLNAAGINQFLACLTTDLSVDDSVSHQHVSADAESQGN